MFRGNTIGTYRSVKAHTRTYGDVGQWETTIGGWHNCMRGTGDIIVQHYSATNSIKEYYMCCADSGSKQCHTPSIVDGLVIKHPSPRESLLLYITPSSTLDTTITFHSAFQTKVQPEARSSLCSLPQNGF